MIFHDAFCLHITFSIIQRLSGRNIGVIALYLHTPDHKQLIFFFVFGLFKHFPNNIHIQNALEAVRIGNTNATLQKHHVRKGREGLNRIFVQQNTIPRCNHVRVCPFHCSCMRNGKFLKTSS